MLLEQAVKPTEIASVAISTAALLVSGATFAWARFQERSATRSARVKALQGDKEAIAYVAYQIRRHAWDRHLQSPSFRNDIVTALCLAFLLEGADRAKALVFSALRELQQSGLGESITPVLSHLHSEMSVYQLRFHPHDFDRRITTLERLMQALGVAVPAHGDAQRLSIEGHD